MKGTDRLVRGLVAASVMVMANPAWSGIKCWINSDGVRECGNNIPPEYAQQGHEELSSHAVVTDVKERAKTEEELAEEARLAEIREKEAEEARRQAMADRVLLDTFSSEADLIIARDGKLASLDAQMQLTQSHIEKLEANLDRLVQRAADIERRGNTPSDKLIHDIESVRQQIEDNKQFIAAKEEEQVRVRQEFAADITRFNELTANSQAEN
jgi:hypothetical protein